MDISFYYVSWIIVIFNPIAAIILGWMVMHYRQALHIGVIARFFVAVFVIGFLAQAVNHVELLGNYREPRAKGWLITLVAQYGIIGSLFLHYLKDHANKEPHHE